MEIFGKVNLCEIFLRRKFACTQISCGKKQELKESTVLPRLHAGALHLFLSQRFGTGVETRRTFHRGLAASALSKYCSSDISKGTTSQTCHVALYRDC